MVEDLTFGGEEFSQEHPIWAAVTPYREEYAVECGEEEWDSLDVVTKMNFAIVHGEEVLTPRQAEAVKEAFEARKKDWPPLQIVLWAEECLKDSDFRPELV